MSIKLNDTQLVLLSAASQRDDHCLVPAADLCAEADRRRRVSVDPNPEPGSDRAAPVDKRNSGVASAPTSPRGGTKIARVIELLQRGDGATLAELVAATGWLPHTTRAALTGLRKRGYAVGIDRTARHEDRSIGSSRRKWRKIAPRRTLKRHRLAKRHQIGPGAPRVCEPVGRRDGDATKRKQRRRGIRPASAIGVSARNPRRFGRETFRPQHGSASRPVAAPLRSAMIIAWFLQQVQSAARPIGP